MKKFEVLKFVRKNLVEKGISLVPNSADCVRLFSVYDSEREVFNPPFTSDEISAVNVFINVALDNSGFEFTLYEIGTFNTDFGVFTPGEVLLCTSDYVRNLISENGGIEE